ncbi:hypothetical protein B0T24DRAFT_45299 [Lasiosphaeria ovina]|uniref:Uncharacterized protein n=1 Tax=Lasiosphaeria ovina TaxID=92902 RepID=A0AAE0NKR1_9PEZI|nr:hypothetical protein B0T24DRAFT_45299 [Lasiosphaeria ovina]
MATVTATEGPDVSHGRGGAGNIRPDDTPYVDGEVVRAGEVGSHGDGAFSTGRGGAANIGDAGATTTPRLDKDVVPESAVRASSDNVDHHTGRGGAGNERLATPRESIKEGATVVDGEGVAVAPVGLADKLKYKLLGSIFKK